MGYKQRGHRAPRIRTNQAIRVREVRVIGPTGEQMGVLKTSDAVTLAQNQGLDLIEIAPNATPPVCRIMDFGKYCYQQSKKEKDQNKSKNATKLKEVKFRVRIDKNDYFIKLRRAEGFLLDANKVKLSMFFRNREMGMVNEGMEIVKHAIVDLAHVATADAEPRSAGRNINVMLSPLPASKRKAKYTATALPEGVSDTDEDESDED